MAFPFFQNLNLEKLKEAQGYVKGKPRVGFRRGGNAFNRVLKNKNQAVRQGARRCDKRSIFRHM
jgi:hypothetical protein